MRFNLTSPCCEQDKMLMMYKDFKMYIKLGSKCAPLNVGDDGMVASKISCTYEQMRTFFNECLRNPDGTYCGMKQLGTWVLSEEMNRYGIWGTTRNIVVDTEAETMTLIPQIRKRPESFEAQIAETEWYLDAIDWLDEHLN